MWSTEGGILWEEDYAIGMELIDKQHKSLFFNATENLLDAICLQGTNVPKKHCINSINFLKFYALQHFMDEENYQRDIGYPGYEKHKEQHTNLAQEVLKYEKLLSESNFSTPVIKRFSAFVLRWLTKHVAEEDKKIGEFNREKNKARSHLIV